MHDYDEKTEEPPATKTPDHKDTSDQVIALMEEFAIPGDELVEEEEKPE